MPSSSVAKNRARGKAFEKKVSDFLIGLGWKVETAHAKLKFIGPGRVRSVSHDFYEAFDHIALHPELPTTLLVQDTIASHLIREKQRKIDALNLSSAPLQQIWVRDNARGRIIVWDKIPNGWEEKSFRMAPGAWPTHILGPRPPSLQSAPISEP